MFKRSLKPFLALIALALLCQSASAAQSAVAPQSLTVNGNLEQSTTWMGDVVVKTKVAVPEGVRLFIEAGAKVRFAPGAGLTVTGELVVNGSKERPVWLGPEDPLASEGEEKAWWAGIQLLNAKPCRISYTHITGARWSEVMGTPVKIKNSTFEKGQGGVKFTAGGRSLVTETTFTQLAQGGVSISTGAAVEVFDSTFTQCTDFGAVNGQRGMMRVRRCTFDSCKTGVKVTSDGSEVIDNAFKDCEVAISVLQSSGKLVIVKNRIDGGDIGILCNQFASPRVMANTITGAKEGIRCFQGSSPLLVHNRIEECETGVSCVQLCKPTIEKNQLSKNRVGIYLQTSSYAVIQHNNFEDNGLHIKLGDMMSADWENRVTKKPSRALQARNDALVKKGRAVAQKMETKIVASGQVSAGANWWGEATTAEMDEKGEDAEIAGLEDSFDTPPISYKGYEGEYLLDRVIYAEWLKAPVEDAGPEGFKPPEEPKKEAPPQKGAPAKKRKY